ncbi:hypothetical protein RPE78_09510 [Thioclava litoralis]|uniref:Uncharacterized protein n=1 Tax=Thioclava litoralis TaxID=3076557 RepID=A0ABZ1DXR6_9RHOB|nr:hypothetical protein RPE78_09510 [Thioclava sp. FTW29]
MPKYTPENTVMVGQPIRVFCNEIEVKTPFEADTDEGYVVQARTTLCGQGYVYWHEEESRYQVATQRIHGTVRVELIDPESMHDLTDHVH